MRPAAAGWEESAPIACVLHWWSPKSRWRWWPSLAPPCLFEDSPLPARSIPASTPTMYCSRSSISPATVTVSSSVKEFTRRLGEKLQSAPGVTGVAWSDFVPLGFDAGSWEHLEVRGYNPRRDENMKIYRNMISPDYLPLLGIPILEGRNFTAHDDEKSPRVMIVNRAFVDHFFAGRSPIGRQIHGWGD